MNKSDRPLTFEEQLDRFQRNMVRDMERQLSHFNDRFEAQADGRRDHDSYSRSSEILTKFATLMKAISSVRQDFTWASSTGYGGRTTESSMSQAATPSTRPHLRST